MVSNELINKRKELEKLEERIKEKREIEDIERKMANLIIQEKQGEFRKKHPKLVSFSNGISGALKNIFKRKQNPQQIQRTKSNKEAIKEALETLD